jgi:hypothetical protein
VEKKLKHLDFLQLVITRMNVNSFLLKGWSVTLVAALFAFATKEANSKFVIITFVSTMVFWFLDGYYLSQERQYRSLYDEIRKKDENDIDFDMNARLYNSGRNTWFRSLFADVLLYFYGALLVITILVLYILSQTDI